MREIKFRAWSHYHKKMFEVGAIDLFWGFMTLQWWKPNERGTESRCIEEVDIDVDEELHEFFGYEIMQYTGLKDKNGRRFTRGILSSVS